MLNDMLEYKDNSKKVTTEIVQDAIRGAAIKNNAELRRSYRGTSQKYIKAAQIVDDNYNEFEDLIWQRLSELPSIKHFFGYLIRTRLKQEGILKQ